MSQALYDEKLGATYEKSANVRAGSTILTEGTKIYADYKGY